MATDNPTTHNPRERSLCAHRWTLGESKRTQGVVMLGLARSGTHPGAQLRKKILNLGVVAVC